MQFNSLTYLAFFGLVYLIFRISPRNCRNIVLLAASYVFYAWWDLRLLFLIILSSALNFCCVTIMRTGYLSPRQRLAFSAWTISAYIFTVLVQWNGWPSVPEMLGFDLSGGKLGTPLNWGTFLALCMGCLLLNLVLPRLLSLEQDRKRKLFLLVGVSVNLLILGFFKYCNFFLESVAWGLRGSGIDPSRFHLDIILPIGISFYTFKGISYVVDASRGQLEEEHSFLDFSLFMAFFPSLLAGPIDRAASFLQQIRNDRSPNWNQSLRGIHLFVYGLFKKVVIADGVIRTISSVFDSSGQASWIDVVVATALFTVQIYCDFSGYTDMARGTAKLFGVDLMVNFKLPYFSKDPREFWSRWHISLSTWLRDYLYIPLGGNRLGRIRTYFNLITTMVLGGLWHGAAWNFVLWGLYHGLVLSLHRLVVSISSTARGGGNALWTAGKTLAMLTLVGYGWLLFRAPSLQKIVSLTSTLIFDFGNMDSGAAVPRIAVLLGLPILLIVEIAERYNGGEPFYVKMPIPAWTAVYASLVFCLAVGLTTESTQFIYMVF